MSHLIHRRDVLKAGAAAFAAGSLGLSSTAFAADPYADAMLVDGEAPAMKEGSFTIVVLPDTQNYSEKFPQTFAAQTKWIAENKVARNVACVLHLGDITNHSTPVEWENAARAMSALDAADLPYVMVPGNHDYSEKGACKDRTTRLNDYFPLAKRKFAGEDVFGAYDKESDRAENTYRLFSAGGRDFLAIGLEFGPRRDVVRWANEIAAAHPGREAILLTHAYMYDDDTRYDWKKYGKNQTWNPHDYAVAKATNDDVLDGEELWKELVAKHENFILTLNGHVLHDGLGRITTQTPAGRDVHQTLVNFQMRPQGGDGWLRLLEFDKDGTTLNVIDYSPTRNQHNVSAQNRFTLKLAAPKV
jgi:3',5'-cyclic AMP phosphodiesterase CpdA